jgi:hypothetical protein
MEDERGGFFGFGNNFIWIIIVIIVILCLFPNFLGGSNYGKGC